MQAIEWHSIVKTLGGFPQGIGGIEDHVHLLIGLKPTHCISDFMRELKKESSAWIHETIGQKEFGWQDGYSIAHVAIDVCLFSLLSRQIRIQVRDVGRRFVVEKPRRH